MTDPTMQQKLAEEYWYKKLADVVLPAAFYHAGAGNAQQAVATGMLPEAAVKAVSRLGKGNALSEYVIYMAMFGFLTGKYFRGRQLLVYSPLMRNADACMPLFHSLHINAAQDMGSYIREVAAAVQESRTYDCTDYLVLSNRFADRNIEEPLIHSIGFRYAPLQDAGVNEKKVKWMLLLEPTVEGQLQATLRYSAHLVENAAAEDFLARYSHLLQQLDAHLSVKVPLDKVELLATAERNQVFFAFNENAVSFPHKTLAALFEEQVERTPGQIALQYGEEPLTYAALNEQANRLAAYLKQQDGVKEDAIIGVLLDRSLDIGIAVMGILKAGAAFLIIDPQSPQERLHTILDDARPVVIITHSAQFALLEGYEGTVFAMDIQLQLLNGAAGNLPLSVTPQNLAYILYTSGTTGIPKGAMITQEAVVNLVSGLCNTFFPSAPHMQMAAVAATVFDPFWKQFFLALLQGHTLHIVPDAVKRSATDLWSFYSHHHIELTDGTPSLLNILVDDLPALPLQLRYFMIGGEKLKAAPLLRLYDFFTANEQQIAVINEYGLTECCVDNICCLLNPDTLQEDAPVPIGRPLPNNQVLILDADNRMVPVGSYGQIGILGKGVGRGYLNRPELTAEKFIDSPYSAFTGKLYLTGDIGKWLPDGNIICVGRLDNQVKVNGYRIELGDVEAAMQRIPGIKEAVAVTRERDGRNVIAAYWTGNPHLDAAAVKAALEQYLPAYMLPAYYRIMKQMPLTVNGKINKQALPDPWAEGNDNGEVYTPAVTSMQQLLAGIWQQVLGMPAAGIRNNFFLNGGDSIKAIQMASQLHGLGYKMEVRDVFQYPTIEELALAIKALERVPDQQPVTGELPLTPVQREFFAVHARAPHYYNQSVLLRYNTRVAPEKITTLFTSLLNHHDALRIVFRQQHGEWIQLNRDTTVIPGLQVFDWQEKDDTANLFSAAADELQRSMQLEEGPLMQLGLFHVKDGSRLLIIVHHLVMDAVSFRILLEDLAALDEQYEAGLPLQLPLKTDAYKFWAAQLAAYAGSPAALKEKPYWQAQLQAIQQLSIPVQPQLALAGTQRFTFSLDRVHTSLLTGRANRSFNTEVQDLLLAAVALASKDVWQTPATAVMLEGHGREPVMPGMDVSRTVGWFTSLYPVVFDLSSVHDLKDAVITVKEAIRKVPAKGVGYGVLRYLADDHLSADVKVPLLFNYLGHFNADASNGVFSLSDEPHGREHDVSAPSPYALEITAVITEGQLHVGLESRAGNTAAIPLFFDQLQQRLQELITYAAAREQVTLTPADLSYKQISEQDLAAICGQYAVQDLYPLSPMQEGILFSCLYNDAPAYIQQLSYRVKSPKLRPALVKASIEHLSSRHNILRTVFLYEGLKRPVQVVLKQQEAGCLFEDLRERNDQQTYLQDFKRKDQQQAFELATGPLLRVAIFRLSSDEYEFVWTHHHLLMDAWCEGILIREYYHIYNSLQEGTHIDLPPALPYNTYIKWIEEQDKAAAKAYWQQYLSAFEKATALPGKKLTTAAGKKNTQELQLDIAVTAGLNQLAARCQVTLNTIMQCIWGILLARYNNTKDVVFGSVVSGRPLAIPGSDSIVGLFINTIPVRIRFSSNTTVSQLLKEVQQQALESEPYHYQSLAETQALSGLPALIDHIMLFDNYPSTEQQLSSGEANANDLPEIYEPHIFEKPHYDLNIRFIPGSSLTIRLDYNGEVYMPGFMERILLQWEWLLKEVLAHPDAVITALDITPPQEKQQLIALGKGSPVTYPVTALIDRFEAQAAAHPNQVALVYKQKELTYAELRRRSTVLAGYLQQHYQAGEGKLVGIMLERTELMVLAVWGILKAGAAFLPVDMALPADRKQFLLKDADIHLLLTTSDNLFALSEYYEHEVIAMDLLDTTGTDNLPAPVTPVNDRLAYVLYTSGSTGQPKGVGINMSSLVNYLEWANTYYFSNETGHCFGLFTSLSFDLSITALFSGLLRGDKLVLFDSEAKTADLLFYLFEQQEEINTLKLTPSHIDLLAGLTPGHCNIQTVILGGEAIRESQIRLLKSLNPAIRIFNEYGPTETTVGCTVKDIRKSAEVTSIGRPIHNTQLYVLDTALHFQPVNATGEIFIGGAGVGNGYLNRTALTSERFISDPYGTGNRLYRSGDLARWMEDGELEYLGRADDQLKVRGYRIEPAEIEAAALLYPGITATVVIAVPDKEGHYELACYYTSTTPIPAVTMRGHLLQTLPAFMVPAYCIPLEKMPLNVNGKISRQELPAPSEATYDAGPPVLPENNMEARLLDLWKETLDLQQVGVCDNFFAMGGNSLKIVRLYDLIRQSFNVQLRISALFDHPTIRQQAGLLQPGTGNMTGNAPAVAVIDF